MSTGLKEMNMLVDALRELRREIDGLNNELKRLNEAKEELQNKILAALEASELSSFKGDAGTVSRTVRFDVKFPRFDNAAKEALRSYLEQKGEFNDKWEMNYQSLNAWYKAELDAAIERGDTGFEIPGLEPSDRVTLQFRGSK